MASYHLSIFTPFPPFITRPIRAKLKEWPAVPFPVLSTARGGSGGEGRRGAGGGKGLPGGRARASVRVVPGERCYGQLGGGI